MARTGGRLDLLAPPPGHDYGLEARMITRTAMTADLPAARRSARQQQGGKDHCGKWPAAPIAAKPRRRSRAGALDYLVEFTI
jgi:hypothetical protein